MKKKSQYLLVNALGTLCFLLPVAIAVWRGLTGKGRKGLAETTEHQEPKVRSAAPLESLSLSTPGDAPLDRLARLAADEKRKAPSLRHGFSPQAAESVADVLQSQRLDSALLPGWSKPKPGRLPVPTYAPAVMAFGTVIFAMGLATVWYVCLIGSLVFAVAAWRWVGELQGE